ncbi:hypothetical protein [Apilactobacillus quenuiae]|uniref:hypothetical protein n=1 Tax=Apilactobacillus quenuiae TaxID=2008377 RepID=UPI000D01CA08|nr:hypothetical protein [Apilactobacillus quenuiae]
MNKNKSIAISITVLLISILFLFATNNAQAAEVVHKAPIKSNLPTYKSLYRKNNYRHIWTKHINKASVDIVGSPFLYSKNLYNSYKSSQALENYVDVYVVSKEKLYNKKNHKYYVFYGINDGTSHDIKYWVRDKWVVFLNQSNKSYYNEKVISIFNGYSTDNNIQSIANLYASYFDNPVNKGYQYLIDFDDQASNIDHNTKNLHRFELKHDKDNYSNEIFKQLNSNKISFKNYVYKLYRHQIGNIYKFGKHKRIGVYVYQKGNKYYGNVIIVINDNK